MKDLTPEELEKFKKALMDSQIDPTPWINTPPRTCPHCGYCPTCGRPWHSNNPVNPSYPLSPTWMCQTTSSGASSTKARNSIDECTIEEWDAASAKVRNG